MHINIPMEFIPENRFQSDAIKEPAQNRAKIEGADFKDNLKTAFDNQMQKRLNELIDIIEMRGKILVSAPIYENLVKYKETVGIFMKEVTRDIYRLHEITATGNKGIFARQLGQKRAYLTIQEVNKNLAALTQEVLKSQSNPINIAARLETIQGLLLDLYS